LIYICELFKGYVTYFVDAQNVFYLLLSSQLYIDFLQQYINKKEIPNLNEKVGDFHVML